MTQYFIDFDEYSTGSLGTVGTADWTVQVTSGDWDRIVTADGAADGGRTLVVDQSASGDALSEFVLDASSTSGDIEVLCKFKLGAAPADSGVAIGPALIASTNAGYSLRSAGTNVWDLVRLSTGGNPTAFVDDTDSAFTPGTSYMWIRLGRVGTTIHAKIWATNEASEPGSWTWSGTDATLTTVKAGFISVAFTNTPYTIDYIGVGTGGDSAPSSASSIPTNQYPHVLAQRNRRHSGRFH